MSRLLPLNGFEPSQILPPVEVLVVGTGAAAAPLAKELVDTGFQVVCLERGPFQRIKPDFAGHNMFDELKIAYRRDMQPQGKDLYVTFRDDLKKKATPRPYRMRVGVGGSIEHWAGQAWRFYEEDFALRAQVIEDRYRDLDLSDLLENEGASVQDWPLTYKEVEPFYEKIEYEVGVGGRPGVLSTNGTLDRSQARLFDSRKLGRGQDTEQGGNIFESVRRKGYPFPPLRDNQIDITFRNTMREMGLSSFHVPTAITNEPWTSELGVDRAGCSYCVFCAGYGCWNGSKSSTLSAFLPYLEKKNNFSVRTFCDVFRVNTKDAGKGRKLATSVDYFDASGTVVRQPARIVILAAYPFQTTRILLNSGIDGNLTESDEVLVGKYFMNRQEGATANVAFDNHVLNGYSGPAVQRRGCEHFNGENFSEIKLKELLPKGQFFLRGAFIGSPSQWLPILVSNMTPPNIPSWGTNYKEYLRKGFSRFMGLQLLVEPLPYEDKQLDLDPTHRDRHGIPICRITNPPHENERRMVQFIGQKGQEILTQATRLFGGGQVWGESSVRMTHMMTHDTGGTRMGSSPDNSVTNRYGQMWQVPNLFPVGGSLFPSMSGHNPTQTIWMLSSWVGSAIAQKCVDFENSERLSQKGPQAKRKNRI